jgi:FAD/FMN-containing dehydrogenase
VTACHLPPFGFRGTYRDDSLARAIYSEAAGIGRIVPAAVAVPSDADDVVTLVKWASEKSLSIVPRGSGSSMAGGAIGSGVVLDLSRVASIGEIDLESRSVWVGAGALRGDVNRAAAAVGLRFPVDPSSGEFCTIGGMVATNAAGSHTLRFGAMRSWVLALDCVFSDGSRAVLDGRAFGGPRRREDTKGIRALQRFDSDVRESLFSLTDADASHAGVAKDSSGYGVSSFRESCDLVDLLVGSEGTLAVIVGVKLLLNELPAATSGVLGAFDSLDAAVKAAVGARAAGAVACELLDKTFLEVASSGVASIKAGALGSVPAGTEAVLLAEVEGISKEKAEADATAVARIFQDAGATVSNVAIEAEDQEEIWELRHAASPILSKLDPSLKSMQFIEDGAVPPSHLAEYVRGVRAALDARGIRGVIFGHAGDAHMHVNPLIDVSKPDWRANLEGLLEDIVKLTAQLGGTLSGEHGDGRLRTPLLDRVWSKTALDAFARIKHAFDPAGILNPGVKVALPNQRPVNDVKYDPSLAPLPPVVREALDRMTDARAYATLRLSMLPGRG